MVTVDSGVGLSRIFFVGRGVTTLPIISPGEIISGFIVGLLFIPPHICRLQVLK
jgi:hypothetical protein